MILFLVFDVKVMKVFFILCLLIKYLVGYGYVLGGVVIDIGLFDWIIFFNISFKY